MSTQHVISLSDAITMTTRFRNNRESVLDENYQGINLLPISESFDKDALAVFMDNTDCKKIRVYYGMDEGLRVHAILVGVNDLDEDMVAESLLDGGDTILEDGQRCPPICPPSSPLNTEP